jgi:hypothetical protein
VLPYRRYHEFSAPWHASYTSLQAHIISLIAPRKFILGLLLIGTICTYIKVWTLMPGTVYDIYSDDHLPKYTAPGTRKRLGRCFAPYSNESIVILQGF